MPYVSNSIVVLSNATLLTKRLAMSTGDYMLESFTASACSLKGNMMPVLTLLVRNLLADLTVGINENEDAGTIYKTVVMGQWFTQSVILTGIKLRSGAKANKLRFPDWNPAQHGVDCEVTNIVVDYPREI